FILYLYRCAITIFDTFSLHDALPISLEMDVEALAVGLAELGTTEERLHLLANDVVHAVATEREQVRTSAATRRAPARASEPNQALIDVVGIALGRSHAPSGAERQLLVDVPLLHPGVERQRLDPGRIHRLGDERVGGGSR